MKTKTNIIFKLLVLLLLLIWVSAELRASGDILVSFRFYQGIKGKEKETGKPTVVTSYHLRPLFVGNLVSETGLQEEKEEIKRIFNLTDLKLMTRAQWGWQEQNRLRILKVIIINGHEFVVGLGLKKDKDTFAVQVIERQPLTKKELLSTEIILPEKKTAVFGFEDSLNKPYFLSLHREKDGTVMREEEPLPLSAWQPELLKRVSPVYPETALKAHVQGNVIMEATTDAKGNVQSVNVIKGHPFLRVAALQAVRKWKYAPYKISGKEDPPSFTIKVAFKLNGTKQEKPLKRFVGSPIDVKLKDAKLEDTLRFFEKVSGISITADPGISGWVTCDFTGVPWDEALQLILRLNDLEMVQEAKNIRVRKRVPAAVEVHHPALEKQYTGEPMDFDFKNAPLPTIFKFMGKVSGSRITVDPGIGGLVSCRMKQVPWDEAVDLMLKVNGLYMIKDKNHIEIRKKDKSKDDKAASIPDTWPTMGYLTDGFGDRLHPLTGKRTFHKGVDIAARQGNQVHAAADGVVVLTESRKVEGNLIIIDHQNGYTTHYAKLSAFNVKKGDKVKKGDVIGLVGNTGVSTAPHLHWEVHFNGEPIDPMTVVKDE